MKILILDDEEFRHNFYGVKYSGHDVHHSMTYGKFVECLEQHSPFDIIHLDHDLGLMHVADSYVDGWGHRREYCGKHAAQKICELDDEKLPGSVIIQSVNYEGALTMKRTLELRGVKTVWAPFHVNP